MKESRATIADVARRAGVDRAVVSKVLSGDPGLRVREETRQRVRSAAADLNYRPNFYARGLARAEAGAIMESVSVRRRAHDVEPSRFTWEHVRKTIHAGVNVHYQTQRDLYLPAAPDFRLWRN